MAIKAEELNLTFDLSEFTWADMLDIRSNSFENLLSVCSRRGRIEGKTQEEVTELLLQLQFDDISKIDEMLASAIRDRSNPQDDTGKN